MRNKLKGPYEADGFKYYILPAMNYMHRSLIGDGWEVDRREVFLKSCSLDTVSIDVGTFVGTHLIPMAAESKMVIGFEPCVQNFEITEFNVKENKLTNRVRLFNEAVGEKKGKASMFNTITHQQAKEKSHLNQITMKNDKGSVNIVSIDEKLKDLKVKPEEVSLIKIDVEGFEFDVLKGASEVLKRGTAAIYLETHPGAINDPLCRTKCYTYLRSFGYDVIEEFTDNDAFWKKI